MHTSTYSHLYLGNAETDPQPVFRDLSPAGVSLADGSVVPWFDEALFGVSFRKERFPGAFAIPEKPAPFEFFDKEGWPLGFPADHRGLPDLVKREFQICPQPWRGCSASEWRQLHRHPSWLRRLRLQSRVVRGIYLVPG
jgi:hypothetical protein